MPPGYVKRGEELLAGSTYPRVVIRLSGTGLGQVTGHRSALQPRIEGSLENLQARLRDATLATLAIDSASPGRA